MASTSNAPSDTSLWPSNASASTFASFLKKRVASHHHALGWVFKAVPLTVWKNLPNMQDHPLLTLEWIPLIQSWAGENSNRFSYDYLKEVLEGLPYVKTPTYLICLTEASFNSNTKQYRMDVQSFTVYGTYQPKREALHNGQSLEWKLRFTGRDIDGVSVQTLNAWADADKMSELEVLISSPQPRVGAGTVALDAAIADVLAKKRMGSARFAAIVSFTGNAKLSKFLMARGFKRTNLAFHMKEGNSYVDRTAWLKRNELVDPANAYVLIHRFKGNGPLSGDALQAGRNLVKAMLHGAPGKALDAACHVPPGGPIPNRLWPACR
jgi:hypothetical protein